MINTQELFSYPIVVIESLWPKLPEEAPKLVGEDYDNKSTDTKPKNSYIYSETQNAFSGYFKIIPLNIKAITVSANKEGHTFDISFDPSYVYVQFDPRYISRSVHNYIIKNSFQFTGIREEKASENSNIKKTYQELNYLSGILEGLSKSQMESPQFADMELEHYFVPGNVISKFVNEMDTVTIFLVQDLAIFDQKEIIKLAGGNFSRRREGEVLPGTKKLAEIGIIKPSSLQNLNSVSIGEKLQSLRSFLFNSNIGSYSYTYVDLPSNQADLENAVKKFQFTIPTPYRYDFDAKTLTGTTQGVARRSLPASQLQELINIINAVDKLSNGNEISIELDSFGPIISFYLRNLLNVKNNNSERIKLLNDVKNGIIQYYRGGAGGEYAALFNTVSWSLFKSASILLEEYLANLPAGNEAQVRRSIASRIIKAIAIDLYLQEYYGGTYIEVSQALINNDFKKAKNLVDQAINNLKKTFEDNKVHFYYPNPDVKNTGANKMKAYLFKEINYDSYISGISYFFNHVVVPLVEQDNNLNARESAKNKAPKLVNPDNLNILKELNLEENLQVLEDISKLQYPLSCETPFFTLNGHITKITDSSYLSGENYTKSMSISGTGFELPMKMHQIYIDATNGNDVVYQGLAKNMISNATPIAAALSILAIHFPDYARFMKSKKDLKTINDQRNFALYASTMGFFVDKGTMIHKRPGVSDSYFIFAPIHYVDKNYLKIIKSTFDSVIAATKTILVEQRNLNNASVYDNLKAFLPNSSMYSFYIDEFGSLKIRFEPSAVTQTSSTILSPIITDEKLTSLITSTDSNQIATVVEVLPKTMAEVTGLGQTYFASRATPPDIVDAYGLYKPIGVKKFLANNKNEFFNFLDILSRTFLESLENIREHYNANYRKNGTTLLPTVARENIVPYDRTENSLKELVLGSDYQTDKEKAEAAAKEQEKQEKAENAKKGTPSNTTAKAAPPPAASVEEVADFCMDAATYAQKAQQAIKNVYNTFVQINQDILADIQEAIDDLNQGAAELKKANVSNTKKEEKPAPVSIPAYERFYTNSSSQGYATLDYKTILFDNQQNFADYITNGYTSVPFSLDTSFFNAHNISSTTKNQSIPEYAGMVTRFTENAGVGITDFSYLFYVRYKISQVLNTIYDPKSASKGSLYYLGSLSQESIDLLIQILASLAYIGVIGGKTSGIKAKLQANITADVTDDKTVKNYVSWMINDVELFYLPPTLKDAQKIFDDNSIIEEKDARKVPYSNFTIQDFNPRVISADFFRYGLRLVQHEDFYARTSKLTDFRAESVRKLYEYPMKTANITTLLNPMYKIGNNVLVVSDNISNNKGTYFTLGLKRMIATANPSANKNDSQGYNLFLRVDDIVKVEGIKISPNSLYTALTGISSNIQITEETVINHFKVAGEFLLGEANNPKGLPVPSDAYVPLLGIYNSKNKNTKIGKAVTRYLKAIFDFHVMPLEEKNFIDKYNNKDGYLAFYEEIEDAIIDVYANIFEGKEFSIDSFNLLSKFLNPQTYHVYQYHINNLTHSWSFGKTSTSAISGTFGTPCLMTYIPTSKEYDSRKHVLGYVTTRGPNHYLNEYGTPNIKLTENLTEDSVKDVKGNFTNENILYRFSEQQLIQEEKYYKSKYRYSLEYLLEKIRRKYVMPSLYGDLIFKKPKDT